MSELKPQFYKRAPEDSRDNYDLKFSHRQSSEAELEAMGDRIARITQAEFGALQPIDFIAIMYSGGIVSSIARLSRSKIRDLSTDSDIQVLDGTVIHDGRQPGSQNPLLLVDNSINSGRTFEHTMEGLRAYNLHPEHFLKLVDYEGAREERTSALLGRYSMKALSVYKLEELIDSPYLSWREWVKARVVSLRRSKYFL